MRKILFIAYYFPPIGGGGVQRSLKFVKYLPQFDWQPVVLSSGGRVEGRFAPRDQALLRDLPLNTKVHRIPGLPSPETRSWGRRWADLTQRTSPFGVAWASAVYREGCRMCEEERPEAIYVSMSPFEGALAASALSKRYGIPWVADLRDPWALDEMQIYPSGLHRRIARQKMRRALSDASLIIMNTPEAARRLVTDFPEYRYRHVISLTNGFDAEDFRPLPAPSSPTDTFRIVHTGSLHTAFGRHVAQRRRLFETLGRIEPGVDFLSRSHVHLLEALRRWREQDPGIVRDVKLILAGSHTPADRAAAEAPAVRDLVVVDGHRSHHETVRLQQEAAMLFLPMHQLAPGRRATIVPGKTYEYLATERPILAAVPEGDAKDFVRQAGTGLICEPREIDAMVRHLSSQYRAWKNGRSTVRPNPDFINQFERRRLTARLAEELTWMLEHDTSTFATATRDSRVLVSR
jgi:glycosyltransferase involved in cell wall biosynthesis